MCGEYNDYTRSYHHPGAQFLVGSSRNWSVFLERPNMGHGASRTQLCRSSTKSKNSGANILLQKIFMLIQNTVSLVIE